VEIQRVVEVLINQFKEIDNKIENFEQLRDEDHVELTDKMANLLEVCLDIKQATVKNKRNHKTLPLRDPLSENMYSKIMQLPLSDLTLRNKRQLCQFKIACTSLFYTGLRANAIQALTFDDIQKMILPSKFTIVQSKQKNSRVVILPNAGVKKLKKIEDIIHFWFIDQNFKYLGSSFKKHGLITKIS